MDNQRLNNKVKQRDFKLNALLEITNAINANLSVGNLLEHYERVLKEHLAIEKILLFTKEDSWKCILRFGVQKGEIKEKQTNTLLQHYGVTNMSHSTDIQLKKVETSLRNYGCINPSQHEEIKNKKVEKDIKK